MQDKNIYLAPWCLKDTNPLTFRITAAALKQALTGLHPKAVLVFSETLRVPARTVAGVAATALADALEFKQIEHEGKPALYVSHLDCPIYTRQTVYAVDWGYSSPQHPVLFAEPPVTPPAAKANKAQVWVKKAALKIHENKRYARREELRETYAWGEGNLASDGYRLHAVNTPFPREEDAFAAELERLLPGKEEKGERDRLFMSGLTREENMRTMLAKAQELSPRVLYPAAALTQAVKPFTKFSKWLTVTLDEGTTHLYAQNELGNTCTAELPHLGMHHHACFTVNAQFFADALAGMTGKVTLRANGFGVSHFIALNDENAWALIQQAKI